MYVYGNLRTKTYYHSYVKKKIFGRRKDGSKIFFLNLFLLTNMHVSYMKELEKM